MSNLRFVIAAAAMFAGAFAGVSWAAKGFPVMAMWSTPDKPEAPAPQAAIKNEAAAEQEVKLVQPVGKHDQLALTALQAANAYARTPCDAAARAAFVVAASTYLRMNPAGPAVAQVEQAIKAAVEAGGLTSDEFPAGIALVPAASRTAIRCTNSAGLQR